MGSPTTEYVPVPSQTGPTYVQPTPSKPTPPPDPIPALPDYRTNQRICNLSGQNDGSHFDSEINQIIDQFCTQIGGRSLSGASIHARSFYFPGSQTTFAMGLRHGVTVQKGCRSPIGYYNCHRLFMSDIMGYCFGRGEYSGGVIINNCETWQLESEPVMPSCLAQGTEDRICWTGRRP